jgi:hypothetical protein
MGFDPAYMEAAVSRGGMSLLIWKPWEFGEGLDQPAYALRKILSGRHDPDIRGRARAAASWGKPCFLRFAHEMNGAWTSGSPGLNGNTNREFVAAGVGCTTSSARKAPQTSDGLLRHKRLQLGQHPRLVPLAELLGRFRRVLPKDEEHGAKESYHDRGGGVRRARGGQGLLDPERLRRGDPGEAFRDRGSLLFDANEENDWRFNSSPGPWRPARQWRQAPATADDWCSRGARREGAAVVRSLRLPLGEHSQEGAAPAYKGEGRHREQHPVHNRPRQGHQGEAPRVGQGLRGRHAPPGRGPSDGSRVVVHTSPTPFCFDYCPPS